MNEWKYTVTVEKWCIFEAEMKGPVTGNPFTDCTITGTFSGTHEIKQAEGFYDGNGIYRIRFMPSFAGEYNFRIQCSFSDSEYTGTFQVSEAGRNNHGPVRVANTYHFAYEDGSKYYPVGTTCYVWELQTEELQTQTLQTLKQSPFNKIRFCIFPKHYAYNFRDPPYFPYEGTPCDTSKMTEDNFTEYNGAAPGNKWDFSRFVPAYFRHIEQCIGKLRDAGIEADLIVMHPYDRWGFSCMDKEYDDLYWHYVTARFAAYRNVWWSLANEYDLMPQKTLSDWERFAQILCTCDPYNHLRSIHNCITFYDHSRPWVTHCSIQRVDVYKTAELVNEWREKYRKPVVLDEIAYEGNIQYGWGNISAQEMVRRFWEAACRGGYGAHSETYMSQDNILWWSHGGTLHGESPARIEFLKKILYETPAYGLSPINREWDEVCAIPADSLQMMKPVRDYYICYYGFNRPSFRDFHFDEETRFSAEVIDTWNMTITDAGIHQGKFRVNLPGREYMAVRLRKCSGDCPAKGAVKQ